MTLGSLSIALHPTPGTIKVSAIESRSSDVAFFAYEVNDGYEPNCFAQSTKCSGPPIPGARRFGHRAGDAWGDVPVGVPGKSGQRSLSTGGLRWAHQLLHSAQSLAGNMEVGHGTGSEPCGDGGSAAGPD